ncbi:unconventional myosin-IXb [Elysia marginata]|uniref:Unconventional myosin-IXb n=1 Tax=Elysia marginata TaxID=1093978 RepID=A0AAV4FW98_9GAST|nr:unconventional myosin-IXb [Elysia marginata]
MTSRYEYKPSNVQQLRRRLSEDTSDFSPLRVYAGALGGSSNTGGTNSSDSSGGSSGVTTVDVVTVDAEKSMTAEDVVAHVCRKLRLGIGPGNDAKRDFELAEVFSSGGQLCKERRLDASESPVALQRLWPKVISSSGMPSEGSGGGGGSAGQFDGYRFYLRRRDPELPVGGWVVRSDQSAVDSFLTSFLSTPIDGKEFPDLCSLPDLNEHTLLHNLKTRFNQKNIYTYVGTILIAVNPFKFFPIYNPKYVSMYQNTPLGELPPHIFAVADAAYHSMLREKKNQCIVISGESGSGKTESTNLLLHHLTALSHKGLHGSGVEQTILGAGPVLEAFGNAKTVHNNNSSRFGKFIQVNYKQNGMVHGAIVEKYLLEKSRIVFQAREERNYHVFYYLLAGSTDREREALHLLQADQYTYLSQSSCYKVEGVDEQHEFARLKQSMEMVGFSPETQKKIFSVLSAVLHLGNVEFKKKGDNYHDESVLVKNMDTVKTISELLKVKENFVLEALTQKKTKAKNEIFVITFKMGEANATRDAMAKCIYGALFDWIVLKVNQALLAKKHDSEHEGDSIGVLDIFGFEDFGRNSFEQFCINYANEHLQYYFNQHIFKFEQEEYQREGIHWKNIEFIDNTGSLELFSKRPSGLFYLLDEECNFPAATNDTLLSKFTDNHKNNGHYEVPQRREGAFSITHYAGKVKYFVKDFREKNLDLVRPEIVATLKKSSMAFVRELLGIDPVAVLRWSVVRAFFRCFFAFKNAGERYRKNGGKESQSRRRPQRQGSDPNVQENLLKRPPLTCSLPETVDVLQQQHRDEVHEELLLYSSLESNLPENDARVIRRARRLLMKNKSFKPKPRPSLSFRDIKALKAISNRTTPSNSRGSGSKKQQPPTVGAQFQWSLSRLMTALNQANPYFIRCIKSNKEKSPCVFDEELVMRQLRYTGMLATVKIRQSGYNYRLLFEEFTKLYKILLPRKDTHTKEDIKAFLESMGLQKENYQIGISKIFLRESEKMKLDEALHSAIMTRVITIQRWTKACLLRQNFIRLREATIIIQKSIRQYLAQQHYHELQLLHLQHTAAIIIQSHIRCYLVRKGFTSQRAAAVFIQSYVRAVLTRRRFFDLRNEYRAAKAREEELERIKAEELERERLRKEAEEQEIQRQRTESERLEREEAEQRAKELALIALRERQVEVVFDGPGLPDVRRAVGNGGRGEHRERVGLKEELQSTASDEGVLLKTASSSEELEEKEYIIGRPRRDSDASSGIMEDSETEVVSPGKPAQDTRADSPSRQRPKSADFLSVSDDGKPENRKPSRVSEIAKTFQTPERDEVDGKVIVVRRGSQRWKQHKATAPLAKQESFSDWELSPTSPELASSPTETANKPRPAPLVLPEGVTPLSDEQKRGLEEVLFRRPEGAAGDHHDRPGGIEGADHLGGHLSPLNKARSKFKMWVGERKGQHHAPPQHIQSFPPSPARTFKFFRNHKSTRKKNNDSEEESEDNQPSHLKRPIESIGVSVLPQITMPSVPLPHYGKDAGLATHDAFKPSQFNRARRNKKPRAPAADGKSGGHTQPRSNIKVARSTEWQYADNLVITNVLELRYLDEFISQKQRELDRDSGNRRYTIFDRIFKGALEKFRKDLKSVIAVEATKDKVLVRYRDLFEQFRQVLEAEMKKEQTDAPLVMSLNAFRGFLDEFSKTEASRLKDFKKDERRAKAKPVKPVKNKKAHDIIECNGHKFQPIQFNIPTFCEVCGVLIWIMDKSYVCTECKIATHKKCYSKYKTPCSGMADGKGRHPTQVFGVELSLLVGGNQKIPSLCERLMSTIERTGLYVEGIYRKSGAAPKIKELRAALEADGENVDLEEYQVHVLTNILKQFLRNLPEPLLTHTLHDDFLRCTEIKDEREMVKSLFDVIKKLPRPNFDLFERLVFHLVTVTRHADSNKMSPNALAVVFAPVLLGTSKKLQAQDAIAVVPQQIQCVENVLKEELRTVKAKLDDIDTLESAEQRTGDRLDAVRASLRNSRQKSPQLSPVKQMSLPRQNTVEEEEEEESVLEEDEEEHEDDVEDGEDELAAEARALTRHLKSIHKEKRQLTFKLPMLETRQASSDEDMLSGDEIDVGSVTGRNEEYAISFYLPVMRPSLPNPNKHRTSGPAGRKLPRQFAKKAESACRRAPISEFEDTSEACLPEPIPTIDVNETRHRYAHLDGLDVYTDTMTVESSYVTVPGVLNLSGGDDDEIMV